jgi:hypothetical protein
MKPSLGLLQLLCWHGGFLVRLDFFTAKPPKYIYDIINRCRDFYFFEFVLSLIMTTPLFDQETTVSYINVQQGT